MQIRERTKKLTVIAVLSALAFIVMLVGRIPMMSMPGLTLKYDPKDVVIIIGGFLYGPLVSVAISFVVSFIEMIFASETGPIGMIMNIVSSCSFAFTAALIYKYKRTLNGAVIGLAAGAALTAVVMVFWNYLITPLYMGFPRSVVVPYLMSFFLPFNLIKGIINAAVTIMIYKPVSRILRQITRDEPPAEETKTVNNVAVILIAVGVIYACIIIINYIS